MDATVIVWLAIVAAILAALVSTAVAVRKHTNPGDDDPPPGGLRDPRDRGFFE